MSQVKSGQWLAAFLIAGLCAFSFPSFAQVPCPEGMDQNKPFVPCINAFNFLMFVYPSNATHEQQVLVGKIVSLDHRAHEQLGAQTPEWKEVLGMLSNAATFVDVSLDMAREFYKKADESFVSYVQAKNRKLEEQIATTNAAASESSKGKFSTATLARLKAAVYLIAKDDGGKPLPEATAWAFAPNRLATNAHVTKAIKDHENEFFLVAPDGSHIKIKKAISHPGYSEFEAYKQTLGTTRYGKFTSLDLINEYDVGIIEIDSSTPLPVDPVTQKPMTLELASADQLEALSPGIAVASDGFPYENIKGSATATKSPPVLHFGFISSLTDVFMCQTEPANQLLIQHSVPVTGGASGSPLIDTSGKVIGIVNGGNTNIVENVGGDGQLRMSNAVQINYAQRVDLLKELLEDNARTAVAEERNYWEKMAPQFDSLFEYSLAAFKELAALRYNVGEGKETPIGDGELDPNGKTITLVQQTFKFDAVPGHVYGFIADAKDGVPIGINVKSEGTEQFLRDAKDPRQSSEPELAPTAWVTVTEPTKLDLIVWSLVGRPARIRPPCIYLGGA